MSAPKQPLPTTETDEVLLRRCAAEGDRQALAALIERYAGMVYAAAHRRTGDADLAQDVSQCVFVIFARRIQSIRSAAALGAWFLQTTRYTAANAMKSQARRRHYEESAAMARTPVSHDAPVNGSDLEPALDEAIARLRVADQNAVVLRFFRGLSFAEVGAAMGTTEDGARKRISRALAQLKKYLIAAGAPSGACAAVDLSALLSHRAAEIAPAHIVARVKAAAMGGKLAACPLIYGATMTAGAKLAVAAGIAAVILAGGAVAIRFAGNQLIHSSEPQLAAQPDQPADGAAGPLSPAGETERRFAAAYSLKPGENFKIVTPPFIAERWEFVTVKFPAMHQYGNPDSMDLEQKPDGTFDLRNYMTPDGGAASQPGRSIHDRTMHLIGARPWELQGDDQILSRRISGDMVLRQGGSDAQILRSLSDALSTELGTRVIFSRDNVEHEMIVATDGPAANLGGRSRFQITIPNPPPKTVGQSVLENIFKGRFKSNMNTQGSGPINNLLDQLTLRTGNWYMDETSVSPTGRAAFSYSIDSKPFDGKTADQQLTDLMDMLNMETGLTFKREVRTVLVWTVKVQQ